MTGHVHVYADTTSPDASAAIWAKGFRAVTTIIDSQSVKAAFGRGDHLSGKPDTSGFVILPRRWVVERSLAGAVVPRSRRSATAEVRCGSSMLR